MLTSQGRPRSWSRAVLVNGRMITSAAQRQYQARLAGLLWADRARRCGRLLPIEGPVRVEVRCWLRRPKTGPHAASEGACCSPDLDNVVKSILDAAQRGPRGQAGGGLVPDDASVVEIAARKDWASPGEERIEIVMEAAT
jgi:Holliday junction resolvase RusA-like endonuclease